MKKIIIGFAIIAVVCVGLTLFSILKSSKTIEEITGVNFDDISYIKTGGAHEQNEDYEVEEFVKQYRSLKYKKLINGTIGNTTHIYFVCYNTNDEVLFTIVEVGNQNKVFIKKGSFDDNKGSMDNNLYQLD